MTSTTSDKLFIPDQTLDVRDLVRPKITMIYGAGGGGKTVMASTYPAPQVWLDMDEGMDSIMWAVKEGICPHPIEDGKLPWLRRAVPADTLDDKRKLKEATGYWQAVTKINEWCSDEQIGTWNTLVIDPITTISRYAMTAGLEISGKYPKVEKPYSESGKHTKASGVLLIGIQDYKPAQSFVQQFVDFLRKVAKEHRKWVVLIAHEHDKTKPSEKIGEEPALVGVEPEFFGKQRHEITKEIDEVYHINNWGTKDKPNFKIQTVKDGFTLAKSRFGCLDVKEEPNYQTIRKKVEAYYGVPLEN